jgi:tRNA(fMet)-specific endonuclease VapC
MNLYVLDPDVLTQYQMGDAAVVGHVTREFWSGLAVTVISVEEQLGGWYTRLRRTKDPDELAKVYQHMTDTIQALARFRVLSFTAGAIRRYEQPRSKRLKVSKNDLRIAAIVQEAGGILATRNVRDYRRIPDLRFEDWSK